MNHLDGEDKDFQNICCNLSKIENRGELSHNFKSHFEWCLLYFIIFKIQKQYSLGSTGVSTLICAD